jgi:UDP:flavonoid glycosyltransferase YjiC (YdhE family)
VFVSSRARQRGKAFRLRWMRLLDEHWIAYPAVIAGNLTRLERLKLGLLKRPTPRFLDVLIPPSDAAQTASVLARYSLEPQGYVLVVPGGGTAHRSVQHAPERIGAAALAIAQKGHTTLLVGVPLPHDDAEPPATLRRADLMPMSDLMVLIREARLVVTNGADTLLQVLALHKPAVAVSLSPDQTERLRRLAAAGVDVEVPLDSARIADQALRLLDDPAALAARGALAQRLDLREGLTVATEAIGKLLPA